MTSIPVIDFTPFHSNTASESQRKQTAAQIHEACSSIGFLIAKNVGISDKEVKDLINVSSDFFSLPLDVKEQAKRGSDNRGYVGVRVEQLNPKDEQADYKEAFNMMPDKNKWVESCKEGTIFKDSCTSFYKTATKAASVVLRGYEAALGLEKDFFINNHFNGGSHASTLRILHYPEFKRSDIPDKVRAGAHSDYGSITLLWQNNVGGLQVQDAQGKWHFVPPVSGGQCIVNTADLLMQWTNDHYISTRHRVIDPPGVNDSSTVPQRFSVAFFVHPADATLIQPLESSSLPKESKSKYEPVTAGKYLQQRLEATYIK
mmetsp:Transcript_4750/g.5149  ORF Transcript_4750/g.5149 Transcript_4750/m.5149 type:complete len:316 (+) Transcript_4750:69-1016(+)